MSTKLWKPKVSNTHLSISNWLKADSSDGINYVDNMGNKKLKWAGETEWLARVKKEIKGSEKMLCHVKHCYLNIALKFTNIVKIFTLFCW